MGEVHIINRIEGERLVTQAGKGGKGGEKIDRLARKVKKKQATTARNV